MFDKDLELEIERLEMARKEMQIIKLSELYLNEKDNKNMAKKKIEKNVVYEFKDVSELLYKNGNIIELDNPNNTKLNKEILVKTTDYDSWVSIKTGKFVTKQSISGVTKVKILQLG